MEAENGVVEEFRRALASHAPVFGVQLGAEHCERLVDYYRLVMLWNPRLHLVAPCSPEEFATRHVLESLAVLPHVDENARVADVGSGAGLPIIPCLVLRADIRATLIESSTRKAVFLREALRVIGAHNRATVVAKRFEETPAIEADYVTCRALDRFTEQFEKLVAWSTPASTLLFFGGPSLRAEIERIGLRYKAVPMPESEQRFLFIISRSAKES